MGHRFSTLPLSRVDEYTSWVTLSNLRRYGAADVRIILANNLKIAADTTRKTSERIDGTKMVHKCLRVKSEVEARLTA